jgi:hypothetical protein
VVHVSVVSRVLVVVSGDGVRVRLMRKSCDRRPAASHSMAKSGTDGWYADLSTPSGSTTGADVSIDGSFLVQRGI